MNAINTRLHSFAEQADEALDRPGASLAMCGCVLTNHLCFAPELRQQLADEALDRPADTTALSAICHLCWAPQLDAGSQDEASDRPDRRMKRYKTALNHAVAPSQDLADESLDRPTAAGSYCRPFTLSPTWDPGRAEEALDRPRVAAEFSILCGCDESLERARPLTGSCHPTRPTPNEVERAEKVPSGKVVRLSDYRKTRSLDRLVA